jgi:hypothetical protein
MSIISNDSLVCPVSEKRVNENVVRVIASLVILVTIISAYFTNYILAFFLAIDFLLRASDNEKFSPIRWVAQKIAALFSLPPKPIPAEPKKFAALLGFVFSLAIALFLTLNYLLAAFITVGILLGCAILESVFGICLGCYVYSYLIVPFKKKASDTNPN